MHYPLNFREATDIILSRQLLELPSFDALAYDEQLALTLAYLYEQPDEVCSEILFEADPSLSKTIIKWVRGDYCELGLIGKVPPLSELGHAFVAYCHDLLEPYYDRELIYHEHPETKGAKHFKAQKRAQDTLNRKQVALYHELKQAADQGVDALLMVWLSLPQPKQTSMRKFITTLHQRALRTLTLTGDHPCQTLD